MFLALGSAAVKEAAANARGLRVTEVATAPDALKRTQAIPPTSHVLDVNQGLEWTA